MEDKRLYCEKPYKERVVEGWTEGMLYRFYSWLFKNKKQRKNEKTKV